MENGLIAEFSYVKPKSYKLRDFDIPPCNLFFDGTTEF